MSNDNKNVGQDRIAVKQNAQVLPPVSIFQVTADSGTPAESGAFAQASDKKNGAKLKEIAGKIRY
jgi:hypothetical protein